MRIGYARVSTDEQHLQLHPYRGIRSLLGLIPASLPLPLYLRDMRLRELIPLRKR